MRTYDVVLQVALSAVAAWGSLYYFNIQEEYSFRGIHAYKQSLIDELMRTYDVLQLALSSLEAWGSLYYFTIQEEYSLGPMYANKQLIVDEVFPWLIGCNVFVKLVQENYLPTFPGLSTWLAALANNWISIATAIDVVVCYVALLRINLSYIHLAYFPTIAICFIFVMRMRHNQLSGRGDAVTSGSNGTGTDNGKKCTVMPEKLKTTAFVAPHFILCAYGMLGDPEHDGNNYDNTNFFLFLTCMLLGLTLMMMKLPTSISRGIAAASELLYKASLVVLLLTAHMVAADTYGKQVVLLLLPEVVPPLVWYSLHVDRRTPIINIQKIVGTEHFFFKAVVVSVCWFILQIVLKDESLLYWASTSCAASGLITYIIVLVLSLWPEKDSFATLSFEEVLELLTFWWKLLLQVAVGLLAFRVAAWLLLSTNGS